MNSAPVHPETSSPGYGGKLASREAQLPKELELDMVSAADESFVKAHSERSLAELCRKARRRCGELATRASEKDARRWRRNAQTEMLLGNQSSNVLFSGIFS